MKTIIWLFAATLFVSGGTPAHATDLFLDHCEFVKKYKGYDVVSMWHTPKAHGVFETVYWLLEKGGDTALVQCFLEDGSGSLAAGEVIKNAGGVTYMSLGSEYYRIEQSRGRLVIFDNEGRLPPEFNGRPISTQRIPD